MPSSTDSFEREIVVEAPRARVWRALTDVREFNEWFGVKLGAPFAAGTVVRGNITTPGYEHIAATLWVEVMEPERRFAFRWHPYAIEQGVDYASEPTTLVTFTLEDVADGTRLSVAESGFDAIPPSRRPRAFSANAEGWRIQLRNIRNHVLGLGAGG